MYILKWLVQDSSPTFLASPPFDTSTFSSQHKVFEEVCAIRMDSNHVISEILCLHVFLFIRSPKFGLM